MRECCFGLLVIVLSKSYYSFLCEKFEFTESDIHTIKQHVFMNEYMLDGEIKRFDPDYDIAESWRRLIDGKDIREMDIVLLRHELLEYQHMSQGMVYTEAHKLAEIRYNYSNFSVARCEIVT